MGEGLHAVLRDAPAGGGERGPVEEGVQLVGFAKVVLVFLPNHSPFTVRWEMERLLTQPQS